MQLMGEEDEGKVSLPFAPVLRADAAEEGGGAPRVLSAPRLLCWCGGMLLVMVENFPECRGHDCC